MSDPFYDHDVDYRVSEMWTAGPIVQSIGPNTTKSRIGMGYNGEFTLTWDAVGTSRYGEDYHIDIHNKMMGEIGYKINQFNYGGILSTWNPDYTTNRSVHPLMEHYGGGYTRRLTGHWYYERDMHEEFMEEWIPTFATDSSTEENGLVLTPVSGKVKTKNYVEYMNPDPTAPEGSSLTLDNGLVLEYERIITCNLDSFKQNANGVYTRGIVIDVKDLPKKLLIIVHARNLTTLDLHDPHHPLVNTFEDMYEVKYHKHTDHGAHSSDQALITVVGARDHVITVKLLGPTTTKPVVMGPNMIKLQFRAGSEMVYGSTLFLVQAVNSIILFSHQMYISSGFLDKIFVHARLLGGENTYILDYGRKTSGRVIGQQVFLNEPARSNAILVPRNRDDSQAMLLNPEKRSIHVTPTGSAKSTKGTNMAQWFSWRSGTTYRYGSLGLIEIPLLGYTKTLANIDYVPLEDSMSAIVPITKNNNIIDVDSNRPTAVRWRSPNWDSTTQVYGKALNFANMPKIIKRFTDFYRAKRVKIIDQHNI